jgi:hypothetical protein
VYKHLFLNSPQHFSRKLNAALRTAHFFNSFSHFHKPSGGDQNFGKEQVLGPVENTELLHSLL